MMVLLKGLGQKVVCDCQSSLVPLLIFLHLVIVSMGRYLKWLVSVDEVVHKQLMVVQLGFHLNMRSCIVILKGN
uniref:Putative ovule protein n=1 Tax=Solanum chacoense TaxID=4108 RepID=A0A0V0HQV0_SOLCH